MRLYLLLFASSFIAASLFPGSPDAILIHMVSRGSSPIACIVVASTGSYFGACLNFFFGRGITHLRFLHRFKPSGVEQGNALGRLEKYGEVALLFSWLPFIGDPLTFVAGLTSMNFVKFSIWVALGRTVRFTAVAYSVALIWPRFAQ